MLRCPECPFITVVQSLLDDHRRRWHEPPEDPE